MRFWSLAFVAALGCGLFACSRNPAPPAAPEARTQSAVATTPAQPAHSGAAGADHGLWATDGNSIPEALREPCAKVNTLVRSVVDSAPKSTKITELIGPRAITFKYLYATARWAVVNSSCGARTRCRRRAFLRRSRKALMKPGGCRWEQRIRPMAQTVRILVTHTMATCAWSKGGGTATIATPRLSRDLSSMFSLRARRCAPTISRPLNGLFHCRRVYDRAYFVDSRKNARS